MATKNNSGDIPPNKDTFEDTTERILKKLDFFKDLNNQELTKEQEQILDDFYRISKETKKKLTEGFCELNEGGLL